jgi:hypothetical protein
LDLFTVSIPPESEFIERSSAAAVSYVRGPHDGTHPLNPMLRQRMIVIAGRQPQD